MDANAREAYCGMALALWEPGYPGEKKPVLTVWFDDEPEHGMSGFFTREDRDNFSAGGHGPFLRVITGNTFRQMPLRQAKKELANT